MVSFSQTGVCWVWFLLSFGAQSGLHCPSKWWETSFNLRKDHTCFSTLMISCSISAHWVWDDFLCFFRLFYYSTCCSHWSALELVLSQSLCSDSAAPWNFWYGAECSYTTHPWAPSQTCSFTLPLNKELGLSAMHREGLDSHIPKHLVLSPPQVLHHVLFIWSSHSSTLHTSTQFPCHPPILCAAQCFLGDAEPPLAPACLKMGNALPPSWLNLYLAFFSSTPDVAILAWQEPW